jgi:hypothetical protein
MGREWGIARWVESDDDDLKHRSFPSPLISSRKMRIVDACSVRGGRV